MNKKCFLIENEIFNGDMISLINESDMLPKNNIDILNVKDIDKLEDSHQIYAILKFQKDLSGNYYLTEENSTYTLFSNKNIIFMILDDNNHLRMKDLKILFTDSSENIITKEKLMETIYTCEMTQKSFLNVFNKKFMYADEAALFYKFFKTLNHSGVKTPNYEFHSLEKLDQISQAINALHSIPFFLKNHSISYRLFLPLKKIKDKSTNLAKNIRKNFDIFKFKSSNKKFHPDHPDYLKKFFEIAGKNHNISNIVFKNYDQPDVSIVIPVYGKIDYLKKCLYSLYHSKNNCTYEVILVDDCGPERVIKKIACKRIGVKLIENKLNQGFTKTCNAGANEASGKYICFLNTDTVVTDNWLDNLLNGFKLADNVGVVGPRLLHNNGKVQESGGIIFNNGDAANIGRNEEIDNSWFKYFKDVDYVSGAALVISKNDFKKIKGFDEIFSPAYYEDTSLCMDVRHKLKKRVVVNPTSNVIHAEGATNGTDTSSGIKKYQEINKKNFLTKHYDDLASYGNSYENLWWDRDKYIKSNILIVDQCIPNPKEDSGSKDMDNILKALLELNIRPHLFAVSNRGEVPEAYGYYERGVHCVFGKTNRDFKEFYKKYCNLFDLVIVSRVNTADEVLESIQSIHPNCKTLFYTVDLHHVRIASEYKLTKDPKTFEESEKVKKAEISTMKKTDNTIVLSNDEKNYLENECAISPYKIKVWPLIRSEFEDEKTFEKSSNPKDIIFIGGFSHTPNIDAVKILENKLLPYAKIYFNERGIELPSVKLYGSKPNSYIKNIDNDLMKYMGYIEDESEAFKSAKLSLAPLPYGAGLKGKVLSSFIYKTPVVGTNYAFEGFDKLKNNLAIKTSLEEEEFAKILYNAYVTKENQKINNKVWDDFHIELNKRYSYESFKHTLQNYLQTIEINV